MGKDLANPGRGNGSISVSEINYIGIDPGKDGAMVLVSSDRRVVKSYCFKDKSEVDIIRQLRTWSVDFCRVYLEAVHSMPGQGVASMFSFGRSYGFLRGIIQAFEIPMVDVSPRKWQGELSLGRTYDSKSQRKNAHKAKAQQLYPGRKITLSDCDAYLLAEYGLRTRT